MSNARLPRIEIDLNARDADGLTRTAVRYADRPLQWGQEVVAYQDETAWRAVVALLTPRYAYLSVKWDSFIEDNLDAHQSTDFAGIMDCIAKEIRRLARGWTS